MSINNLLSDTPKPWANLRINNINCDGNAIITGNLIVTGQGGEGFVTTDILCENLTATVKIDANNQEIKNVGYPSLNTDAANKQYVLDVAGGGGSVDFNAVQTALNTPTSDLNIPGGTYTYSSAKAASTNTELIRKQELDSVIASTLSTASNASNLTSGTLSSSRLPAFSGDIVTSSGSSVTSLGNSVVTNSKMATNSVNTTQIIDTCITNAKLATMASDTIKGNNAVGSQVPIDLSVSQVRTMINVNNVPNINATDLDNDLINGTFTPDNNVIVSGDTGKEALQKAQGQIDDIIANLPIPDNSILYDKIQQETALTILGNPTNALANVQEIYPGNHMEFAGSGPYYIQPVGLAESGSNTDINSIQLNNIGLHIKDNSGLQLLTIRDNETLTADRELDIITGDSNRTLTLTGNSTLGTGSLSGNNTGDQTITLTGDVTGSGTGSFATTISNNAVTTIKVDNLAITDAKINDVAASKITGTISTSQIANLAVTDAKINDVNYSKITSLPSTFPSKTSTLTVDSGLDFAANEVQSSYVPTIGSDLTNKTYVDSRVAGGGITTLVQYVNVGDNVTTALNNAVFQSQIQLASTAFVVNSNTNYTWTYVGGGQNLMNVLIQASAKKGPIGNGAILQSTGTFSYQTGPTLRGMYWNDIQFTFSTFTIRQLLSGSFTNCTFDNNIVIDSGTGFIAFNFCTFNSGSTLTINNSNTCSIFFNQCNFSGITVTNNVLFANSSTNIFLTSCTGLRNYTDFQASNRSFYSGINSTSADSREYVITFSPYDAISGAQHLWTSAEIANLAIATGNIANLAVTNAKINDVAYSKITGLPTTFPSKTSTMTVDSNIDMLNTYKLVNLINPTLAQDAVTLNYLQSKTMQGTLFLSSTATNWDTAINAMSTGNILYISPNSSNYTLSADPYTYAGTSNNISITTQCKVEDDSFVTLAGTTGFIMSNTVYGWCFSFIKMSCPITIKSAVTGPTSFDNVMFTKPVILINCDGTVNFVNCDFNGTATININVNVTGNIYFKNCNFHNKTITNSTTGLVTFDNCLNLPSLTSLGSTPYMIGINTSTSDTRCFVNTPGFYGISNLTKYLYVDSDISSSAAITRSKLANDGINNSVVINNGTGVMSSSALLPTANFPALTGDVTNTSGSLATTISANAITNSKVSTTAAIARTKLANDGINNSVVINDGTGVMSSSILLPAANFPILNGDITTTAGSLTTTIASNVIVNSDINTSANIQRSKLATGTPNYIIINDGAGVMSEIASLPSSNSLTNFSNADYTVLTTNKYIIQIGTMSATRTVTLPLANAVASGFELYIGDSSNTVNGTNMIHILCSGSDLMRCANGGSNLTNYYDLITGESVAHLISDGTSSWTMLGCTNQTGALNVTNNTVNPMFIDAYSSAGDCDLVFRAARGNYNAPTASQINDFLCFIGCRGNTGSGFSGTSTAYIGIQAGEAFTPTAQGSFMTMNTTPLTGTTRSEKLKIFPNNTGSSSGIQFSSYGAGACTLNSSGLLLVSSDERLKDIQSYFTKGLSSLTNIAPITYKWKESSGYADGMEYTGFSAQNVQLSIPEAVAEDKHGILSFFDRPVTAACVNAINELVGIINTQKDRITALEDFIKAKFPGEFV